MKRRKSEGNKDSDKSRKSSSEKRLQFIGKKVEGERLLKKGKSLLLLNLIILFFYQKSERSVETKKACLL